MKFSSKILVHLPNYIPENCNLYKNSFTVIFYLYFKLYSYTATIEEPWVYLEVSTSE
jgi:hypothetical protein